MKHFGKYARLGGALLLIAALLLCAAPVQARAAAEETPKPVDRSWKDIVQVVAGADYTAVLRGDGQVLYTGRRDPDSLCAVEDWAGVEKLEQSGDAGEYLVALCWDGTALAMGPASSVAFDLSQLQNVTQLRIGQNMAAALLGDGTVRIVGASGPNASNDDEVQARYCQQRVTQWGPVRQICFSHSEEGKGMLVGICADGKVVSTDRTWADEFRKQTHVRQLFNGPDGTPLLLLSDGTLLGSGRLEKIAMNVYTTETPPDWTNVAAFYPGPDASYALTRDGRVLALSLRHGSDARLQEVRGWTELVQLGFDPGGGSRFAPVGLRADGTVVTAASRSAAWDTGDWTGVVKLFSGAGYTLGLRADGTVLATGGESARADFVDEVAGWTDIAALYVSGAARPEGVHVLGLRYNGKLVAAGNNDYAQCQVK